MRGFRVQGCPLVGSLFFPSSLRVPPLAGPALKVVLLSLSLFLGHFSGREAGLWLWGTRLRDWAYPTAICPSKQPALTFWVWTWSFCPWRTASRYAVVWWPGGVPAAICAVAEGHAARPESQKSLTGLSQNWVSGPFCQFTSSVEPPRNPDGSDPLCKGVYQ